MSVKTARILAGLTQEEMAIKIGVCRHTYIKIEKDPQTATIGQAVAISKATGCSIDEIFFGINST